MRTVLIIDDSISARAIVKQALEAEGFQVKEAGSPAEASVLLDGSKVHLIIIDYNMPGENGVSFVKRVKGSAEFPAYKFVPVILMTTETDEEKKMAGKEAGVSAWVVKPFVPESLV